MEKFSWSHAGKSNIPIKKRPLIYLMLFVVLTLIPVALILLIECVTGYFGDTSHKNIVPDARLNHKWRPHSKKNQTELAKANPEFSKPYLHVYNKQGWLEKYDVQLKKPVNTYRIFYVGDSFIEGTLPMEQSVPSRVENYLNDKFATSGKKFEVINTGTSSYSPVIYYILIRYIISQYSPDLIVVNVDMTDNFDDYVYRPNLIVDSEGNPFVCTPINVFKSTDYVWARLSFWNKMQLFLFDSSSLYRFIYKICNKTKNSNIANRPIQKGSKDNVNKYTWVENNWNQKTERDVQFTMDILERIAKYCKNNRIKLLFTSSPHYNQLIFRENGQRVWSIRPHQEIRNIAQKAGIPYLDSVGFLEPYIKNSKQSEYYYKNNMHYNPRGYKLWAKAHIQALLAPDNRLLPDFVYKDSYKKLNDKIK
ncbi:MAG: hypothetical protein PHQ96_07490 [Candidatus Omnitrophica bacterium]|nr:hypothetical protein [Candidatus Omnitrophota bacterium]